MSSKLAILGGTPVIDKCPDKLIHWPIVNDQMRKDVLQVLEDGNMSGSDISRKFEDGFAKWHNRKYALAHNTGTNALIAGFYGLEIGPGDEVIAPALTYWASCLGVIHLGGSVVFCDVDPFTLQMDPDSLESRITPRTKAIVVVHYKAYPCDMDRIMAIAKKHNLKVMEDVSHAQGGHYKGKILGTFGDVAAMSLMSGKSFAIGEGGMLLTDNEEIFRRAVRFGHYDRIPACYKKEEFADTFNLPVGGVKNRMHQMSAAVGLVQLTKYETEIAEIDKAMKYFWNGVKDIPGLQMVYPAEEGSDKAGWYASHFMYDAEAFSGVSNKTFSDAVAQECDTYVIPGAALPLHKSSLFSTFDIFGEGRATASRFLPPEVDLAKLTGDLPVTAGINDKVINDIWFKHCDTPILDKFIEAFHKVAEHHQDLLAINDTTPLIGQVAFTRRKN